MSKKYKAIFFDWDGTAVMSRQAPVEEAVAAMKPLLASGVKLVIVSGTTYDKIASGKIHEHFTPEEASNLYLGLGRGAYNYKMVNGQPEIFADCIPDTEGLLKIHDVCYKIHRELLEKYNFKTDVVFSRPNYCKIDLQVENERGDQLFMQEDEMSQLKAMLEEHVADTLSPNSSPTFSDNETKSIIPFSKPCSSNIAFNCDISSSCINN